MKYELLKKKKIKKRIKLGISMSLYNCQLERRNLVFFLIDGG